MEEADSIATKIHAVRRANKPLVERKRREKINLLLEELKHLVLKATNKQGAEFAKMEKADILEMVVSYMRSAQHSSQSTGDMIRDALTSAKFRAGFHECVSETMRYLSSLGDKGDLIKTRLVQHLAEHASCTQRQQQHQQHQQQRRMHQQEQHRNQQRHHHQAQNRHQPQKQQQQQRLPQQRTDSVMVCAIPSMRSISPDVGRYHIAIPESTSLSSLPGSPSSDDGRYNSQKTPPISGHVPFAVHNEPKSAMCKKETTSSPISQMSKILPREAISSSQMALFPAVQMSPPVRHTSSTRCLSPTAPARLNIPHSSPLDQTPVSLKLAVSPGGVSPTLDGGHALHLAATRCRSLSGHLRHEVKRLQLRSFWRPW